MGRSSQRHCRELRGFDSAGMGPVDGTGGGYGGGALAYGKENNPDYPDAPSAQPVERILTGGDMLGFSWGYENEGLFVGSLSDDVFEEVWQIAHCFTMTVGHPTLNPDDISVKIWRENENTTIWTAPVYIEFNGQKYTLPHVGVNDANQLNIPGCYTYFSTTPSFPIKISATPF